MSEMDIAAEKIQGILSPEAEPGPEDQEAAAPEADAETEELVETAPEGSSDEAEEELEEGEGEPETGLAPPATMNDAERAAFVSAPREVQEWSLRLHKSQQSTLSTKSAELSTKMKEIEAERAVLDQQRQSYTQALETLPTENPPHSEDSLKQLKEDDPVQWSIAVNENTLWQQTQAARKDGLEKARRDQEQQLVRQQQEAIQAASQQLPDLIPDWKDEKVAATEKSAVVSYLQSNGYEDQVISSIVDPRIIMLVNKARKWDDLQAGKVTQLDKARRAPKMGSPGTPGKPGPKVEEEARNRLKKSGKVEDAVTVIEQRLSRR